MARLPSARASTLRQAGCPRQRCGLLEMAATLLPTFKGQPPIQLAHRLEASIPGRPGPLDRRLRRGRRRFVTYARV